MKISLLVMDDMEDEIPCCAESEVMVCIVLSRGLE
jgi:hypothetical protein